MRNVTTQNEEETISVGKEFAKKLKPGDTVFLFGDLGFGKTTLVKGIAQGLGIKTRIISPTFIITREHNIKSQKSNRKNTNQISKIFHIDLYRLEHENQLEELGIKEIIQDELSIKLIEWPEKLSMQPNWNVRFALGDEQNTRSIRFTKHE